MDVNQQRARFVGFGLGQVEVQHLARVSGADVVEVLHRAVTRGQGMGLLALSQKRKAKGEQEQAAHEGDSLDRGGGQNKGREVPGWGAQTGALSP